MPDPFLPSLPFERLVEITAIYAARLERLSADSIYAHRASGLRGSLLKALDEAGRCSSGGSFELTQRLNILSMTALDILQKAAHEIQVPESEEKE